MLLINTKLSLSKECNFNYSINRTISTEAAAHLNLILIFDELKNSRL